MRSRSANRTRHDVKLSYADRVLCAVSLLQKERKKRFVHPTSLRAQVRKTARVRKDKLGPQWSSWVGRAVQSLESYGVLQSAGTSGAISLSPNAKKAFASARRELDIPNPTLPQEDQIWRSIRSEFSGKGVKRLRLDSDDGQDEEVSFPPVSGPSNAKGTPTRRAKPATHMTRAENELRSVNEAHLKGQAELNTVARNLDQKSQELQELRQDYRARVEEIDRLYVELSNQNIDQHTPATPTPTPRSRTHTPELPSLSLPGALQARRPPEAIRTQSGSYISHFSKQPTPAPSEPEDREDGFDHMLDTGADGDVFQGSQRYTTMGENGLPTPQTSPYRGHDQIFHKVLSLQTDLSKQTSEVTKMRRELELERSKYQASCDRVIALEVQVNAQLSTLSETEHSLSARIADNRLTHTHLQTVINEQSEARERLVLELEGKISQAQDETAATTKRASSLQAMVSELQSAVDQAKADLTRGEGVINQLTGELAKAKQAEEVLLGRISGLETENRDLGWQVASKTEETSKIRSTLANMEKAEEAFAATLAKTKEEQTQQVTAYESRVAQLESTLTLAKGEANSLSNRFEDLETAYHAECGRTASLQQELTTINESRAVEVANCQFEMVSLRASVSSAQAEIDDLRLKSQASEAAHDEVVQTYDLRFSSLQTSLSAYETLISELRAALESSTTQLGQVTLKWDESRDDIEKLRHELSLEQTRASALQEDLRKTLASYNEAERGISKLSEAKRADEKTIQRLVDGYVKLKTTQMACFTEMDRLTSERLSGSQRSVMPED